MVNFRSKSIMGLSNWLLRHRRCLLHLHIWPLGASAWSAVCRNVLPASLSPGLPTSAPFTHSGTATISRASSLLRTPGASRMPVCHAPHVLSSHRAPQQLFYNECSGNASPHCQPCLSPVTSENQTGPTALTRGKNKATS